MNPELVTEMANGNGDDWSAMLGTAITEMGKQGVDPDCETRDP